MAIGFAAEFLNRAIETQLDIVPEAETRAPHLTEARIRTNVERDQGRGAAVRR